MFVDSLFVVIGQLGGFISIHKTAENAEEQVRLLNTDNKYEDSFEIIPYTIVSKTEEIYSSDIVYVMLCAKSDLPLLITKDRDEFEIVHTKFLNLYMTYPEPFNYWGHVL